jgi:hypothetical protein
MKKKINKQYDSLVTNQRLKEKVLLSALLAKLSNEHKVYRNTNDNGVFYTIERNRYQGDTILLLEDYADTVDVDAKDMHL